MSTERPEPIAVELDPEAVAEEHHADDADSPDEYAPSPELDSATREADPADVAEQLDEVPELAEDEDDLEDVADLDDPGPGAAL